MFATYKETLDYLFSKLPMYQRIGAAAYKANLDNTWALCTHLNNPQQGFKSIHIAGTNGKGSTSHMIASVLQEAGYKVGLYTSPHLKDFRERIKINGKKISQKKVIAFVNKHSQVFDTIHPSFFEMTVALAFDYFAEKKVDVAVIEVGLGGRLDSTNVIMPDLSIITNISYDHVHLLGNTLPKIALEKAGIIKHNTPVVIGETQKETKEVFISTAAKNSAPIVFADKKIKLTNCHTATVKGKNYLSISTNGTKYDCELSGMYQKKNCTTVLCSIERLNQLGYSISNTALSKGLKNVIKNTGLLGRWQQVWAQPKVIADIGHNEAGIKEILAQLKNTHYTKLHWVLGVVNDKDYTKMLSLLPKTATYYFCKAKIPRSLDEQELQRTALTYKLHGKCYKSVKHALRAAKTNYKKGDLILVCGSTFIVAEAI
ncbi:MAG: bifunctional folylpolyglutamate synthase/dihydrofolate synthase [Bacteroidetes bacterium]|nr:bifunctional folylpolyglutamate synthase/dihydrofolate synthase [Bacteroidota bacterium]